MKELTMNITLLGLVFIMAISSLQASQTKDTSKTEDKKMVELELKIQSLSKEEKACYERYAQHAVDISNKSIKLMATLVPCGKLSDDLTLLKKPISKSSYAESFLKAAETIANPEVPFSEETLKLIERARSKDISIEEIVKFEEGLDAHYFKINPFYKSLVQTKKNQKEMEKIATLLLTLHEEYLYHDIQGMRYVEGEDKPFASPPRHIKDRCITTIFPRYANTESYDTRVEKIIHTSFGYKGDIWYEQSIYSDDINPYFDKDGKYKPTCNMGILPQNEDDLQKLERVFKHQQQTFEISKQKFMSKLHGILKDNGIQNSDLGLESKICAEKQESNSSSSSLSSSLLRSSSFEGQASASSSASPSSSTSSSSSLSSSNS